MSEEESQAVAAAFQRQRELKQLETERFLEWVRETAEAEEKAELQQKIRELEQENESLREFSEHENDDPADNSREEFERDLVLTDEAAVLADLLADEEVDIESGDATIEPTDHPETSEQDAEPEDEFAESGY